MYKKEFVAAAFGKVDEVFLLNVVAIIEPIIISIYIFHQAQPVLFTSKKTKIPSKYSEFLDFFSPHFEAELLEHTNVNNHLINLVDNKHPPDRLILQP